MNNKKKITLDHIVYCVPDLHVAMDEIESKTGVRPIIGGKHVALGTHNAFLSLGDDGSYLELFAPDPDATTLPVKSIIGVDSVASSAAGTTANNKANVPKSRITTYCCNAGNVGIDTLVSQLQQHNQGDDTSNNYQKYYPSIIESGSRKNDVDGTTISWKVAIDKHSDVSYKELPMGGLIPFFIDWGDCVSKRPGSTIAPKGCTMLKFTAYHPNPNQVKNVLENIGYDVANILTSIEEGPEPKLVLTLQTPNGIVELS